MSIDINRRDFGGAVPFFPLLYPDGCLVGQGLGGERVGACPLFGSGVGRALRKQGGRGVQASLSWSVLEVDARWFPWSRWTATVWRAP